MRSGVSFTIDCNNASVFLVKGNCPLPWCSKFFNRNKVKEFLNEYQLSGEALGQIQFNMVVKGEIVKIHGDPTINHHDWVVVGYSGKWHLCHVVCFVNVSDVKCPGTFQVGKLDVPGLYGICHFVNQDVFTNATPIDSMYSDGNYISYRTDENCSLIRGWAKFTDTINGPRIPWNKPIPSLAMFAVKNIILTCIGIKDCQNWIPLATYFCLLETNGPSFFTTEWLS